MIPEDAIWILELIRNRDARTEAEKDAVNAAIEALKAQLSQEGTTSDLISRQAARHALCKAVHKGEDIPCENQTASCLWTGTRVCDFVREIDALPSVQPEALTDKEQRIFLAAMGREEKVCRQVDDECRNCREPYEDSLVRTCHEIERKVKCALWT